MVHLSAGTAQWFSKRSAEAASVYREVQFDQPLSCLKPISGEEIVLELVRFAAFTML